MNEPSQHATSAARSICLLPVYDGCVEAALEDPTNFRQHAVIIQEAIDAATAGLVPIQDVLPILESNGSIYALAGEIDKFLKKHGDKLK